MSVSLVYTFTLCQSGLYIFTLCQSGLYIHIMSAISVHSHYVSNLGIFTLCQSVWAVTSTLCHPGPPPSRMLKRSVWTSYVEDVMLCALMRLPVQLDGEDDEAIVLCK